MKNKKHENKQIQTGVCGDNIEFIDTSSLKELYEAEKKLTRSLVDAYRTVESNTKKDFYMKLLEKLKKIKSGELHLDHYIEEITEKIKSI